MAKHIQTQTEWESTMARRIMDQLRGELYLDQRYLNAALGALPPAPAAPRYHRRGLCRRRCPPVLSACLGAGHPTQKPALPAPGLPAQRAALHLPPPVAGAAATAPCGAGLRHRRRKHAGQPEHPATTRPVGWLRQQAYQQLQNQCGLLAAGPIYRVLRECDEEMLTRWLREFTCDDHRFWPADPDSPQAQMQGQTVGAAGPPNAAEHGGIRPARRRKTPVPAPCKRKYRPAEAAAATGIFCAGSLSGMRNPISTPKNSTWAFYSYGLRVYGNLPLIEPLESREVKKIRDFVIVLDTSESTRRGAGESLLKEPSPY